MPNRGFTVEWPGLGVKLEAGPLPFNRKLFDCFWRSLPFRTIQLHAMVSGEDMYSYCPVSPVEHIGLVERQVPIHELPPGSITWSTLGLVAIVYGPCTESLRTQPIAAIPKRFHEDLKRAGRAAWDSIFTTKEKLIVEFGKKKESRG